MKFPNPCISCRAFYTEFREFVSQGNVIDLAVGIIIGTAFSNVVKSLIEDIITPPFGLLLGGVDFSSLVISMSNFVYTDKPPVVIRYGKFLEEILHLIIIALVLFFMIKGINKLKALAIQQRLDEENRTERELSDEAKILLQIRDILISKTTMIVHELVL